MRPMIGGVMGGVLVALIIVSLVWYHLRCRRRRARQEASSNAAHGKVELAASIRRENSLYHGAPVEVSAHQKYEMPGNQHYETTEMPGSGRYEM